MGKTKLCQQAQQALPSVNGVMFRKRKFNKINKRAAVVALCAQHTLPLRRMNDNSRNLLNKSETLFGLAARSSVAQCFLKTRVPLRRRTKQILWNVTVHQHENDVALAANGMVAGDVMQLLCPVRGYSAHIIIIRQMANVSELNRFFRDILGARR